MAAPTPAPTPPHPALPAAPLRFFASDNAAGAHPAVLEALNRANEGHALAYGSDPTTRAAEEDFRALFDADVEVVFAYGGSGANVLALACMLRPAEAVVCTSASHIAVDETGAPERILVAKLIDLPSPDAKMTPEMLASVMPLRESIHHAEPGVVSLTQVTELGTLYEPAEVRALCDAAHAAGLAVHMDGARIANATAALGGTRAALRAMTTEAGVDVLTFGGTKAGGVFGEAVVFCSRDPRFTSRARRVHKQVGQLHSKTRFIAAQYRALLADDLFIDLGRRANAAAARLHGTVADLATLRLGAPPRANSLYPTIAQPTRRLLQDWTFFWDWDPARDQARWMTAWDVTAEDVDAFAAGVRAALR